MFGWLRRKSPARPSARIAGDALVYAVGDIHGRDDLLGSLLATIGADAAGRSPGPRRIVYLGDYVDRGMQSREVIDRLLLGPPAGFEVTCLMGNHEEAFLAFLDGEEAGFDWLRYGGLETLHSYGVPVARQPNTPRDLEQLRAEALERVPAAHVGFMRDAILWHGEGDYLFVHAGVRPGLPLERQQPRDLLWIRDEFLNSRDDHGGRVVVHGHTICDAPDVRPNRINIDTGAYASGRLTALVLSGNQRAFLAT